MLKYLSKDKYVLLFITALVAVLLCVKYYMGTNVLYQYYVRGIGNLEGVTITGDSVVQYGNDTCIYVTGTSVEDEEWYKVLFIVVYDENVSCVHVKDISPNYCCKPKKYLSVRFTKPSPGIHKVTVYIIAGKDGKVRTRHYTVCGVEYVLSKYEYYLWRYLPCDYVKLDSKQSEEYCVKKSLQGKSKDFAESFYEAFGPKVYKAKLSYSFYVVEKGRKERPIEILPYNITENKSKENYTEPMPPYPKPVPYPTPSTVPFSIILIAVIVLVIVGVLLLKYY